MSNQDNLPNLIIKINFILKDNPLFYLSNDPERSLGLEGLLDNFYIVHIDANQYTDVFDQQKINYFCLEKNVNQNTIFRSSLKLLQHIKTQNYIQNIVNTNNYSNKFIQTFKISPAFEMLVKKLDFKLLNTSAKLNRLFEDKLSQFTELQHLKITIPKTFLAKPSEISFETAKQQLNTPFVIQFNRGHTGGGTLMINNEYEYTIATKNNSNRLIKFSQFITGLSYTINAVVGKTETYMGGLSYQITGIPELTTLKGGTVGNDFGFRAGITDQALNNIKKTVDTIANHMRNKGYLGLFGLDFIIKNNKVYVIEINARQPASIPLYSKLQIRQNIVPLSMIHLLEFLNIEYKIDSHLYNIQSLKPINFSQIFLRAKEKLKIQSSIKQGRYTYNNKLKNIDDDFDITNLNQNEIIILSPAINHIVSSNAELARIQIAKSVMKSTDILDQSILNIFNKIKKTNNNKLN